MMAPLGLIWVLVSQCMRNQLFLQDFLGERIRLLILRSLARGVAAAVAYRAYGVA